jgi:DNA-directed RNA polymerase subunit RPC12/RpoP
MSFSVDQIFHCKVAEVRNQFGRCARRRPRHSSSKACRPRRSEGNRITTIDRSGRRVTTAHGINLFRKDSLGRVPEQCVCSKCGKNRELIGYETSEQLESKNCRSKVLVRLVQSQFAGPGGSVPHFDQHFNSPWNTLLDGRSSATCKPHDR